MAIVETRRHTKAVDEVRAVDGIDIIAREGEFLVLLGPSGCGKTTLMRMIAGLERPTSGDIVIDGNIVNDLPPRARNVAMVFQSYALYPHLTVEKNISFPLRALGMPKDEMRKKVDWAAQMFGIQRFLDRKPRQLSGGERQRVALARAARCENLGARAARVWRGRAGWCESVFSSSSTTLCRILTPSCATPRVT